MKKKLTDSERQRYNALVVGAGKALRLCRTAGDVAKWAHEWSQVRGLGHRPLLRLLCGMSTETAAARERISEGRRQDVAYR